MVPGDTMHLRGFEAKILKPTDIIYRVLHKLSTQIHQKYLNLTKQTTCLASSQAEVFLQGYQHLDLTPTNERLMPMRWNII